MATDPDVQALVGADAAPAGLDPCALVYRFLGDPVANYEHGLPAADVTVTAWDNLSVEQQERIALSPLYAPTDLAPVLPGVESPA